MRPPAPPSARTKLYRRPTPTRTPPSDDLAREAELPAAALRRVLPLPLEHLVRVRARVRVRGRGRGRVRVRGSFSAHMYSRTRPPSSHAAS